MTIGFSGERVGLKIIGPLPISVRGHEYILVRIDYFTKWTEAKPLLRQDATSVANAINRACIIRWVSPLSFHSDCGSNFESQLMQEVVNAPVAASNWYPTLTCGSSKLGSSQRPHPGQPSRPAGQTRLGSPVLCVPPHPAAQVSPLKLAAWNVRSLLDNPRSNPPEWRTALLARELARYKVDIAALSETGFSEQG
ncbi:unnamed protein product [Schistocephalus solidus]|uniref:Integrase catalytic domain-containing protein n=1 Tax=Schistocephalus solidus TaxID=70667 RepID=A0A183SS48_SCHSO|nr:unnamed protein product [Schistocephalus solidus]